MKKRIIVISAIVLVIIVSVAGNVWYHHNHAANATKPKPIYVQIHPVEKTTIPNVILSTGNLIAYQQSNISPKVDGYVTDIFFHEGDLVHKDDVLVQLDNSAEKNAVAAAKVKVAMSKVQFERDQKLMNHHLMTEDDQFQTKLAFEASKAALDSATTQFLNKTIRAPFTGIVGEKKISVGDFVSAGSQLVQLIDTQQLQLIYTVPSDDIAKVSPGQTVTVKSSSYPNAIFHGKVTYIASYLNPNSQTITLHATLDNENNLLKSGLFVQVEQQLGMNKTALVIPENSLLASIKGYYVFTIKDNVAVKTPVKIGLRLQNGLIEVTQGLKPNQIIITAGQNKLEPGSPVKIVR